MISDNRPEVQARRLVAVKNWDCPKCGAMKGIECKARHGTRYDVRYYVHAARIRIETASTELQYDYRC